MAQKRRVRYYADDSVTALDMEAGHVMRPVRVRMVHSLVRSLGLDAHMDLFAPPPLQADSLLLAHSPYMVRFLQSAAAICADPARPEYRDLQQVFNCPCAGFAALPLMTDDTPLFPDTWRVVSSYSAASIACARSLIRGEADIAINWAGGMHHAMPGNCSGFCHVNDIVLAIRTLRAKFRRVLYIDLDCHHGDGVEIAFVDDPSVVTLSLHQFGGGFFPGTGDVTDAGFGPGEGFSVNLPVPFGTRDDEYKLLFGAALRSVVAAYDPEAVVLQCGADTIYGDPVGGLHISTRAFADCARMALDLRLPTVMLGGGGYNVTNTARAWAILTAVAVGRYDTLPVHIPSNEPYLYPHYATPDAAKLAASPTAAVDFPALHVDVPSPQLPPAPTAAVRSRPRSRRGGAGSPPVSSSTVPPGGLPQIGVSWERLTQVLAAVNQSMYRVHVLRRGLERPREALQPTPPRRNGPRTRSMSAAAASSPDKQKSIE
jgi:histone deacetylase 1/2